MTRNKSINKYFHLKRQDAERNRNQDPTRSTRVELRDSQSDKTTERKSKSFREEDGKTPARNKKRNTKF